jgi:hypothetical protein
MAVHQFANPVWNCTNGIHRNASCGTTFGGGNRPEMGIAFLVRHAQASFLEPNYDKLSKLGEAQARLLGEYWVRHKVVFDRACTGPCVRQKDTHALASDACRKAGIKFPDPLVNAGV